MSKQNWAPEPWIKDHGNIIDANENDVIRLESGAHGEGHYDIMPDAETYGEEDVVMHRIIACVNACAGVPTGWLISLTKGEIKEFIMEHIINAEEATDGHDNIGPPAHDNFRWFPDPEDL